MRKFLEDKKTLVSAAFIAAVLFSIRFLIFFLPHNWQASFSDGTILGFFLAVGEHVCMLPIIWFLPAPRWSKMVGSLWVVNDIITDIVAITGSPVSLFLTVRYLGHLVLASPWFFAVGSYTRDKKIRWFAWATGFFLAFYTILFVFFHTSGVALLPVAFSLPAWLVLVGFSVKNNSLLRKKV